MRSRDDAMVTTPHARRRWPARMVPAALLVAGALATTTACSSTGGTASSTTGAPTATIAGTRTFEVTSRNHVEGTVQYPQSPPVGGDHNPRWRNCGAYAEPVPNEQAVHSMEHGAVWIAYRPDLPTDQVASLQRLAKTHTYVLVSPYPGASNPVTASAWGTQLPLDSATDPRLQAFVTAYAQGPQTPEPGAVCTNAIGSPL